MNTAAAIAAGPVSERRLGTIGNEDWWAVVVGLAIVIFGLIDYALGTGVIKFLGVSPAGMKWVTGGDIAGAFRQAVAELSRPVHRVGGRIRRLAAADGAAVRRISAELRADLYRHVVRIGVGGLEETRTITISRPRSLR